MGGNKCMRMCFVNPPIPVYCLVQLVLAPMWLSCPRLSCYWPSQINSTWNAGGLLRPPYLCLQLLRRLTASWVVVCTHDSRVRLSDPLSFQSLFYAHFFPPSQCCSTFIFLICNNFVRQVFQFPRSPSSLPYLILWLNNSRFQSLFHQGTKITSLTLFNKPLFLLLTLTVNIICQTKLNGCESLPPHPNWLTRFGQLSGKCRTFPFVLALYWERLSQHRLFEAYGRSGALREVFKADRLLKV